MKIEERSKKMRGKKLSLNSARTSSIKKTAQKLRVTEMMNLTLFLLRRRRMLMLPLMLLLVLAIQTTAAADSESVNGVNNSQRAPVQWQILTKTNYSSEVRSHPHIILMVTVPWCGESRSLKKELVNVIMSQPERFSTLKLMLVYRNNEGMLANALGASEGITIFYFHHSVSYKYGGKLRVQNLLSSIHSVMSLLPGELPLKFLNTSDELRNFFDSTDKALLLLEFCGWTPRLLAKGLIEETNRTQVWEEKMQTMEDNKMSCNVHDGFSGFPSLGDFILGNDGILLKEENMTFRDGFSCTLDELQRLESFFPKFIKLARDLFLPPERLRFGVVSERSLLSELVDNASSAPWLMKLYSAGCPSCSKILGEGDDLKIALETQDSIVKELRHDVHDVPTLPANRPTVLLFIERSSESLLIQKKSKEALDVFRKLALHHQNSNQKCGHSTSKPQKLSYETHQALSSSKAPSSELFPALRKLNLNDKMSIMIMNNGKQISLQNFISDFQGGTLQEVLANLLQDKNKSKLSSLAKDAGFQLLSDDFVINRTDEVHGQPDQQPDQTLSLSPEGDLKGVANLDEDLTLQSPGTYTLMTDEETKPTDAVALLPVDENHPIGNSEESSEKFINFHASKLGFSQDRKFEDDRLVGVREQIQQKNCSFSFFFCDGHFRLLKGFTGSNSTIPSLVIVDPVLQKHFILPESDVFNFSVLSDFLDGFLNGNLLPYQQLQPVVQSPREAPTPPFVNLDFHEAESIPRVTVDTFDEMVIGNESDSKSSDVWDTDVLVLFTSGWCGFCQRMEMVVREAFRAIKGYANMLKMGSRSDNFLMSKDNTEVPMKIPLIYLMDCTRNDCSLMLTSIVQREIYPSLLLFPARQKNAIIYEGDVAVYDVIKFLSDHGALVNEKGISWPGTEEGGRRSGNNPAYKSSYFEVLLKDQIKEMVTTQNSRGHSLGGLHESTPQILVGSLLTATDKLKNVPPFDESRILIVKVDQPTGFEGLILNKHIHWESLEELDEDLQMMKAAPLSYGGPVMKHGMPLAALAHKSENEQHLEVLPDVQFLDQWATLQLMEEFKLGNKSVHGYWFFLGFSSWGWEQLFHEIAEGAWDVSKGTTEQLDWPEDS